MQQSSTPPTDLNTLGKLLMGGKTTSRPVGRHPPWRVSKNRQATVNNKSVNIQSTCHTIINKPVVKNKHVIKSSIIYSKRHTFRLNHRKHIKYV